MTDVLIVPTGESGDFDRFPPAGDVPVSLGRELSLARLDYEVGELVLDACRLRGHFYWGARQYGQRYAFVREVPADDLWDTRWDQDESIRLAVALSRFIVDNYYSTQDAARVVWYTDGQLQVRPFDGLESRAAYRLTTGRDWLTTSEAEELRDLLAAYWAQGELPSRVWRALWAVEHLAWERYVDISLPGFVAALEGLIGTSRSHTTRQFVTRVHALAAELGVPDVSKNMLRQMYEARSQGYHGSAIDLLQASRGDETVVEAARLQAVLRAAIRRAIEDPQFCAVFEDDEAIRRRWPVEVRHRLLRWQRRRL